MVGKDALGRDVRFGQIYDPATSRQLPDGTWIRDPFPGNIIPQDRFSRVTKNILKYDLPDPQRMQLFNNNLRWETALRVLTIDNWEGKIDHIINNQHKVSGALIYNGRSRLINGGYKVPGLPIPGPAMAGDFTQATPGYISPFVGRLDHQPHPAEPHGFGLQPLPQCHPVECKYFLAWTGGRHWACREWGHIHFPVICFGGQNTTLSGDYLSCYGAPSGQQLTQWKYDLPR